MHILVRIAETYQVAVLVTNQIQASPDAYFGDAIRPTGGHVLAHTSTYRIYLKRSGKNRIARMVDSPYHAEREILFTLSNSGISDVNEAR
jgi:DNA repair protein RadA